MKDSPFNPYQVDWPPTEEIRDALRCDNSNCACHRQGGSVHCPAHDDSTASLSVDDAPNTSENVAKSLWFCRAGCPQDAVTKALHKLVFEGPDPTNTGTSSGDHATNVAAPKTCKTLRQRGISAQTRRHFGIESFRPGELRYPVRDANGNVIYHRTKSTVPGQPKYMDLKTREIPNFDIYNMAIVDDSTRMKRGLYLVKSEFEVWVMY